MIPVAGWVAPFGDPRINACSRLPVAFRSVPRPSSPPGAKASTECPCHTRYRGPSAKTPGHAMHRNHPQDQSSDVSRQLSETTATEPPSTGSGTVPELFYSAHNRIFLSGRRIASLTQRGATSIQQDRSHASEPSPPTVGAPRLHAHDPGQTSQPNDASGPARRGQSATVGTFSPTADDQPPGNRHDDAPRDAPEPDSQ